MRLLVTRPEPEASATAEELRALGHEPIVQPLIEFNRVEFDPEPLLRAQMLIITSGNALRAIQESGHIASVASLPLFCVGEETARRAKALNFNAIAATADSAESLAKIIADNVELGTPLVHVTGEHQAFNLPQALSAAGVPIYTLRVYSMKPAEALPPWLVTMLNAREIDGVLLMSPRTAEIFVRLSWADGLAAAVRTLLYFCLSNNVCERLSPIRPSQVRVPVRPTRQALLDLVAASA